MIIGEVVFGPNRYTEYQPGTLPIVITVPHGGTLTPANIADRADELTGPDAYTDEIGRRLAHSIWAETGAAPHLVISRLQRIKLDANRPLEEACDGDPSAVEAWQSYHGFIASARDTVVESHGAGLLIDLHGHSHDVQRLELGYLLTVIELALESQQLDPLAGESSIRHLDEQSPLSLSALVRGPESLGARFEEAGYPSVPSPEQPWPAGDPYYNGGYTVRAYGSMDGGTMDAIQLEVHATARDSSLERIALAAVAGTVIVDFANDFYHW